MVENGYKSATYTARVLSAKLSMKLFCVQPEAIVMKHLDKVQKYLGILGEIPRHFT